MKHALKSLVAAPIAALLLATAQATPVIDPEASAAESTAVNTGDRQTASPFFTAAAAWRSAMENNKGLQSREFVRRAEKHGVREAWAAFLPHIEASGSYGWSEYTRDYGGLVGELTETENPSRYDVGLNQVIYSHRAAKGVSRAKAADRLSGADLEAFRLNIGYLAIEAYLEAARIKAEAQIVTEQVINEEKRLEQLSQMREHGFASRADTLEAQASLDEIRAEEISLKSKHRAALMHLQAVTGIDTAELDLQPAPVNGWRSTLMLLEHDWLGIAMQNSGELQRSRSELDLAEQTVKLERAAHFPELHLSARYNQNDTFSTNVLEESRVEVQLRVPIYSGGATSARTRQAKERMHAGRYELQDAENNIRVEVARLQEELRGSHGRIQALQAATKSAEVALEVAEQGFRGGVRSLNELLDSRTRLSRTQRNLVTETHQNLLYQFRLRQVAGTLSESDVIQTLP